MWAIAIVMPNGTLRVERGLTFEQVGIVQDLCRAFSRPYELFLEV